MADYSYKVAEIDKRMDARHVPTGFPHFMGAMSPVLCDTYARQGCFKRCFFVEAGRGREKQA
jgi:hypothetical protein